MERINKESIYEKIGILVLGVIIGGLVSYFSNYTMWKMQSDYQFKKNVKDSRENLIVEAADLFSYAPRIKSIVDVSLLQANAGNAMNKLCMSAAMLGKEIESCQKPIDYTFIERFGEKVFEYNTRFQKLSNLLPIYFCDKTIERIEQLQIDKPWWEIDSDESKDILSVMHREYQCKF